MKLKVLLGKVGNIHEQKGNFSRGTNHKKEPNKMLEVLKKQQRWRMPSMCSSLNLIQEIISELENS